MPLVDGAVAIPAVRSADLDRDGHRDLVLLETLESYETRLTVLLGTGAGRFSARQVHSLDGVPPPGLISDHENLQISDVNGDGLGDVVLNDRLHINEGSGRFRQQPLDVGLVMALGDLDGNGALDLVAGEGSSPLRVALGTGDGTFQPAANMSLGGIPHLVADLSGDGRKDVLASDGRTASLYRGDGGGRLTSAVKLWRARGYLVGVVFARSRRPARASIVRMYADDDGKGGTVLARRVPVR